MQLLKRILTAVLLIPIVLLLVLRGPVPVLALVAALVALLAGQELLKISEAYENHTDALADLHFCRPLLPVSGGASRTGHAAAVHFPYLPAVRPSCPPSRRLSFW